MCDEYATASEAYVRVFDGYASASAAYVRVCDEYAPASEAYVFKQTGNLPSEPVLYSNPAIANFKNPFFNNAPVGKIFTSSVKELKPQITGPHQGDIQTASSNAIQRVEQKKQTPAQSWAQFLKDVGNVAT